MTALSNLLALLSLDDSDYLAGLTSNQSATEGFASKLSKMGGAVVVGGLAAAATAIGAVGVAAWDAGETMDGAMDSIAVATGATGSELQALQKDFEDVFTSIPTDAQSAADALGILNSRLDVTGPSLQNIAEPLLEATRVLGGDLSANAEGFTRVMGDWSIPVDNAASSLDSLFVAAQETGAPLDQLMERIVQYGAPMRNFGFNFEEAGALLASFEAQGVNTEIVMSGLRTAQGKFITQGKDMKTGLWSTIDAIKNAKSSTEGLAIATETFGAKAAGDMFDTIRSGKFDIQALTEQMGAAQGTIMETGAATADWGEKWTMFKNKITVALAPIGGKMMDAMSGALDQVIGVFERPDVQSALNSFVTMIGEFITQAVTYIPILIDGFFQFIDFLKNNQGIVVGVLAALGAAALAWGITTAIAAVTAMLPLTPIIIVLGLIAAAAYLLYEAWTNNWGGIQEKVKGVWSALQPVFDTLKQWLAVALPIALDYLKLVWNNMLASIQIVWQFLQANVFPLLQALGNLVSAVLSVAFRALAGIWQNVLLPGLKDLWSWFNDKIMPVIKTVASWLGEKLKPAFSAISNEISKLVGWINNLADRLRNIHLPAWMTPGSPTPWEIGLRGVGDAMRDLSRSELPTFQTALQLQPEPLLANGSIDLQTRSVSAETGGSQQDNNDALLKDVQRLLRTLPETIAKANRDSYLKAGA
jgi:phage-related minor tail protein